MITKDLIIKEAANLIASEESFSPVPYWDVKRWSWGYGTIYEPSKELANRISKEEAKKRMEAHITDDFNKLVKTAPYLANDWLAVPLLSKIYQYGDGIINSWGGLIHDKVKLIQEAFFIDEPAIFQKRRKREIEYYHQLISNNSNWLSVLVIALLGLGLFKTFKK